MGLFKKIGKVFKKVGKVAFKVAPLVLAGAAIIFTGGAALGLAPLGFAGWGAAAAGITSSLGLAGTAGGAVLTGALTHAGFGAAIGGVGAAVMGGDPIKGAQMGAATGAVTGGVTGGIGFAGATGADVASQGAASASPSAVPATGIDTTIAPDALPGFGASAPGPDGLVLDLSAPPVSPGAAGADGAIADVATNATIPKTPNTETGLGGLSDYFDKETVGNMIAKGAGGLLRGFAAKSDAKALRDEQRRLTASYDGVGAPPPPEYAGNVPAPLYRSYRPRSGRRRYEFDGQNVKEVVV